MISPAGFEPVSCPSSVTTRLLSIKSDTVVDTSPNTHPIPMKFLPSSSSSHRVDSRGPLCQPGVATTTSLGPFGTNAEGVPSPICWIHEWRGRPGRRRQPGPKRELVLTAATYDNARWETEF